MSAHPEPSDATVLFFCACLVGAQPGTVYLTPFHLCLTFGLGGSGGKVCCPLRAMDECAVVALASQLSGGGGGGGMGAGVWEAGGAGGDEKSGWNTGMIGGMGTGAGSTLFCQGLALMGKSALKIGFYSGAAVLLVMPIYLEAAQVKRVVLETRAVFRARVPPPPRRKSAGDGQHCQVPQGHGQGGNMTTLSKGAGTAGGSSPCPRTPNGPDQGVGNIGPGGAMATPKRLRALVGGQQVAPAELETGWDFSASKDLL